MKIAEIMALVPSIINLKGDTLNPADAVAWANDLQKEYAAEFRNRVTTTVTATVADTWYAISAIDFLRVDEVRDSSGYRYTYWEADVNKIRFGDTGTYTVSYFRMPTDVKDEEDQPDCHAILHPAFAYYFAYRYKAQEFPEAEETLALRLQFEQKMSDLLKQMQKRPRFVQARTWR